MLETPWQDLPEPLQELWLWGTGDEHITFTWRGGSSPMKYGGTFEGIIPALLSKYRNSQSRMQLRRLEKFMSTIPCPGCQGERLNPQARAFTVTATHSQFADQPEPDASGGLPTAGRRRRTISSRNWRSMKREPSSPPTS